MPPRGRTSHTGAPAPDKTSLASPSTAGPSTVPARAGRALRARDSSAGRAPKPGRVISKDEMERIMFKLSPEGTAARRDELVRDRETELRVVMEQHDMAVKEKFHLERYVSILEGWDPEEARVDNSPVFMDYKNANYNLLDLVAANSLGAASIAGPSRGRNFGPARTTRRQLHVKSEALGIANGEKATPTKGKGKGRASTSAGEKEATPPVGRGRTRPAEPEPVEVEETPAPVSKKSRGRKSQVAEMPPPPVPSKSSKARRATIAEPEVAKEELDEELDEPVGKGKKRARGRQSLPSMPSKKARAMLDAEASPSPASSPAPTSTPARSPSPTPAPAPLPSLAHLPFPPPPRRPSWKRSGPSRVIYTDPNQRPPKPVFNGDIDAYLESYIHIEDTGPPVDEAALEARAQREAYLRNRVNWLQHQGRLLRLLDEDDEGPIPAPKERDRSHQRKAPVGPPPRQTDYHDSLLAHMTQVRTAMINEAKMKPVYCKRIARMIQLYWEHIQNKDERERIAQERELKRKGKEVVKALRKRWGLAVKIVRAKVLAAQKLEQDRLGKEHLQNMLQRSTGLLEAQREDIVGGGRGTGESDDEDAASDATAVVSAAEESEGEAEDEGEEEGIDGGGEEAGDAEEVEENGLGDDEAVAAGEAGEAEGETGNMEVEEEGDSASEAGEPEDTVDLRALVGMDAEVGVDEDEDVQATAIKSAEGATPVENGEQSAPALSNGPTVVASLPVPGPSEPAGAIVPKTDITSPASPSAAPKSSPATEPVDAIVPTPPTMQLPDQPPVTAAALDQATIVKAQATEHLPTDVASAPAAQRSPSAPPSPPAEELPQRAPSRRIRKRKIAAALDAPDPDANDVEFAENDNVDDEDAKLDADMADAEAADADSEDEGLLAEANMPIEELLKRYGYSMQEGQVKADTDEATEETAKTEPEEVTASATAENDAEPAQSSSQNDQSLTDAALDQAKRDPSPALVVDGKRQRRVRTVWTPPTDQPQHLASKGKKGRVQIIEPEPSDVEMESTPELSSEEETDEDEEVEDDEQEAVSDPDDSGAPRLKPPFLLRGTLRPYQHAGLEWLASLYANNMNGILADEMGLGKTIQTIALLGHLACDLGVWGPHLIIVPTSVILNWEMEFKRFLPGMKVLTYYGNQKERKEKRVGWNTENAWQVCITSYQIVLADQHIFRRKNWVYMILDEAHNIKNFRSQRWQTLLGFKTQRRLLLTGTPLQNNLMELWSLLYFLMPNGITADATAVVGFANHKEFMEWFSNPMDKAVESGETMDEDMIETVNKLHTLLRPFILRRLKSEVETQLPGKFEHVVYCRLSKRQRFLYDEFMSRASTREALTSGGYLGVVNILMQLRKVCNHPDLFEVRPVRTSFAMDKGVASDFEPTDVLVRKRLLDSHDDDIDLASMNLIITGREGESGWAAGMRARLDASNQLPYADEPTRRGRVYTPKMDMRTPAGWLKYREHVETEKLKARWRAIRDVNRRRCQTGPIFGTTTLEMLSDLPRRLLPDGCDMRRRSDLINELKPPAGQLVHSLVDRLQQVTPVINRFAVIPPTAVARDVASFALAGLVDPVHPQLAEPGFDSLHAPAVKLQIAFPDASLLQYDCGKLQKLYEMLRDLKAGGHRVLIFTQMTRVLDILEMFLSYNGHRYLRLDGSTKIEDRQIITERFNSDPRIFCFIASSRSGGVGINLTGADTVFFYDSDWNPSMDRQCMDRAHRIGQTREVHIYRFVSSHTVEENMLKKANQKRLLDRVVIQEGDFTTEFFGKMDWRDMLDDDVRRLREEDEAGAAAEEADAIEDVALEPAPEAEDVAVHVAHLGQEREFAAALAEVEDEEDAAAARVALGEGEMDFAEFDEGKRQAQAKKGREEGEGEREKGTGTPQAGSTTRTSAVPSRLASASASAAGTPAPAPAEEEEDDEYYDDDEVGGVDEYMLRFVEWDWDHFSS